MVRVESSEETGAERVIMNQICRHGKDCRAVATGVGRISAFAPRDATQTFLGDEVRKRIAPPP
jgi:hypothetical protein